MKLNLDLGLQFDKLGSKPANTHAHARYTTQLITQIPKFESSDSYLN